MGLIEEISEFLQKGRSKKVKELVQKAMDENMDPKIILNEGLLSGMMIVGAKFKNNEVFVPEVLVSARAMNARLAILEPKLVEAGNEPVGRADPGGCHPPYTRCSAGKTGGSPPAQPIGSPAAR